VIRPATPADIPALVALGRQMAEEAPRWRAMPYDASKVERMLGLMLEGGGVFVAEVAGQVVGTACALLVEHWFTRVQYAGTLAVYVTPEHRGGPHFMGLMRAFEAWGRQAGAVELCVGVHTMAEANAAADLYARLGYGDAGVNLVKPSL
jgi:GNAT superfamily N-acetyltransferase